jgi:hypothetical protein
VADNQHAGLRAQAKENETIFVLGVIWIVQVQGALVEEHSLGLFERDLVLPEVRARLALVPFKANIRHALQCNHIVDRLQWPLRSPNT